MQKGVEQRLKQAKLRLTAQRLAVLEAVGGPGMHQDAETIVLAAKAKVNSLSRQAVYDNLNALVAAGIIRRIEPAGRPALYESRVDDNHHHLICRTCYATFDVDCTVGAAPCLQPSTDHGFLVDEAEVIFWGICPTCQQKHSQGESN
jgi:Fur family transcriptional regulator, stress-responsive regulator